MENGTNVQEEEAVSDLTSVQETEGETEKNTTEAAVEAISVETPQAGTIAEGAANQAAATVVYEPATKNGRAAGNGPPGKPSTGLTGMTASPITITETKIS